MTSGNASPVIVGWRRARAEFLKTLKTGTTLDRSSRPDCTLQNLFIRGTAPSNREQIVHLRLQRKRVII